MKTANAVIFFYGGLPMPAAPALTAPANAAALDDTTPDFSWQAVPGAVTYDIEIRTTLTGTPTATGIATNSYTPGSALDAGITYSWRVRGVNVAGIAGAWSSTRTLSFDYATYMANVIASGLWLRLKETSGNPANSGGQADLTIAQSNCTQNQAGQFGAGEAYAFNGTTSKITVADHAFIQGLSTYTLMALVRADGMGENNVGTIVHFGTATIMAFRITTSYALSMGFDTDSTDAVSITTANFISPGVWSWLFATYDNAGDRKCRIYKGVPGTNTITEASYASQTAATGTRVAPVGATIGNFNDVRTWLGAFDEVAVKSSVLTLAQMEAICLRTPPL